jgi:mono/diheme cytochrome c family protein
MFRTRVMTEPPDQPNLEASTTRWMWVGLLLMVLLLLVFPIYRIYEPAQRAEARTDQLGFLAAQGEEIYDAECASCHGPVGRGGLGPAVGSTNFLESVEDHQIVQLISLGVPGTEMVAYSIDNGGPMTSEEIESIAVYLRSLEETAEPNPFWQTPLAAEDLSGEELFAMACARCHGVDRMGIEDVAPDISETSFAMEESDEWLTERIHDGYKGMPRFARVLAPEQIDLVVTFLRGGVRVVTTTTAPPPDAAVTTTTAPPTAGDVELVAEGKLLFEVTAGGRGCADCHGLDAQGTQDGPNIIGASKGAISGAMGGGVPDMDDITLSQLELEAVYLYLRTLSP